MAGGGRLTDFRRRRLGGNDGQKLNGPRSPLHQVDPSRSNRGASSRGGTYCVQHKVYSEPVPRGRSLSRRKARRPGRAGGRVRVSGGRGAVKVADAAAARRRSGRRRHWGRESADRVGRGGGGGGEGGWKGRDGGDNHTPPLRLATVCIKYKFIIFITDHCDEYHCCYCCCCCYSYYHEPWRQSLCKLLCPTRADTARR